MSTPYAGTATYPATIPLPEDGVDDDAAATYSAPLEALADRTAYLTSKLGTLQLVEVRQVSLASGSLATTASNAFSTSTDYEASFFAAVAGDYLEVLLIPRAETAAAADIETCIAISVDAAAITSSGPTHRATIGDSTGSHEPMHPTSAWLLVGASGTAHIWLRVRNTDNVTNVGLGGPGGGLIKVWRLVA